MPKYNQTVVLYRNHSSSRNVWRKQVWQLCASHVDIYPGGGKHKRKNGQTWVVLISAKAISKEPLQTNRMVKPSEAELWLRATRCLDPSFSLAFPLSPKQPKSKFRLLHTKCKGLSLGNFGKHLGKSELFCAGGSYRDRRRCYMKTAVK